jgi:hypothetical protein
MEPSRSSSQQTEVEQQCDQYHGCTKHSQILTQHSAYCVPSCTPALVKIVGRVSVPANRSESRAGPPALLLSRASRGACATGNRNMV